MLSSSDPHLETLFWHGVWHTIWKCIWHIYSDILSDILSGIYSDNSCWHSNWHLFWHTFQHIFWHFFWHSIWHLFWHTFQQIFWHFSDILSGIYSAGINFDIPFGILSGISLGILCDWGPGGTLWSGARGWDPAGATLIRISQLRSGGGLQLRSGGGGGAGGRGGRGGRRAGQLT